MNLLSIGAAYGAIVAVYQWGWLTPVFAVSRTGPMRPVDTADDVGTTQPAYARN